MTDFRWMSCGGTLLDGNGDIQLTDPTIPESLVDQIYTRLQADHRSWKLYRIGANLSYLIGESFGTTSPELERRIRTQITESIAGDGILPKGSFRVETVPQGSSILAVVYISGQAIASVEVPLGENGELTVF